MSGLPGETHLLQKRLLDFARRFWPDLERLALDRRLVGIGEVLTLLYAGPLAAVGLVWLIAETEATRFRLAFPLLLVSAMLSVAFYQLRSFLIVELRRDRYGSAEISLEGVALWAALFLVGPQALWLAVLSGLISFLFNWRRTASLAARWSLARSLAIEWAGSTLAIMLALKVYKRAGGEYPLATFEAGSILLALGTIALSLLFLSFLWAGYLGYHVWVQTLLTGEKRIGPIISFFFFSVALRHFAYPFGILAAGLFLQNGWWVYLFFMGGMLIVAFLTRQLSWAAEGSRQQSRLLEKLEQLGRAMLNVPQDPSSLPRYLEQHVPNMFPASKLAIWLFPDRILYRNPSDWDPALDQVWPWLLRQRVVQEFHARDPLPWRADTVDHNPILIAPILDVEGGQAFGGLYLDLYTLAQPWSRRSLRNLAPAAQALASQIASALHQAEVYTQTLEYQQVADQLRFAGTIQSSLLPHSFPKLPGWQLGVALMPVGETSGDFFDIIPLAEGKIGLVVADVLDKGVGPAMFMAISRTLIRTFAVAFDSRPEIVFYASNERILADTNANMFVTIFYGVLDPASGDFTYSNAGHNPPYLFRAREDGAIQELGRTGIPIGIDVETSWGSVTLHLEPGDVLVLYTDGIPDAQNSTGEFFGHQPLIETVKANLGQSAEVIQAAILEMVQRFVGDGPQFDDITLMVVMRDVS